MTTSETRALGRSWLEATATMTSTTVVTEQPGGPVTVRLDSRDRVWTGDTVLEALDAFFAEAVTDSDLAEAIADPAMVDLMVGTDVPQDVPLGTAENHEANVAMLRSLPTLRSEDVAGLAASEIPVLVDVWGPRCSACVLMAPVIHDLARRLEGKLAFVQVDAEADTDLRDALEVRALPTYLLFARGRRVGYYVGFRGVDAFMAEIEAALA